MLAVASADRDDRDPRLHRLEETVVLPVVAVPRNDEDVNTQGGHVGLQLGLRGGVDIFGHERAQPGQRDRHDSPGVELGHHLPPQRANEMRIAGSTSSKRDVRRRRPASHSHDSIGREARPDVYLADSSSVQRTGQATDRGR